MYSSKQRFNIARLSLYVIAALATTLMTLKTTEMVNDTKTTKIPTAAT